MFRDITFGQYYPSNSIIHKMDARVKLLAVMFYMVVIIFFVTSFVGFLWITVFMLTAIFLSKVPLGSIVKSVKAVLFLLLFSVVINLFFTKTGNLLWSFWIFEIYDQGLIVSAKLMLRLTYLIMGSSLLTFTTTPVELTYAIESLMKPWKLVRFPVREFALTMNLTLSLIPGIITETDRIIRAQKARGADFDTGNLFKRAKAFVPILIPLLLSGFRRAEELALAMNSRCFEGAQNPTRMHIAKLSWRDLVGTLFVLIFFSAIIVVFAMEQQWNSLQWLYF